MYQSQFPRPPSETLPTMYDLPSEDPEEPGLPDEFHDFQPKLLRETCKPTTYPLAEIFVGADLNLYYDGRHPQWYKRPDWFLSLGVTPADRQDDLRWSYVIWQESVSPFLVVELLSPGTENDDLGRKVREIGKPPTKWEVYERILRVPFYVVFDRYENQLRVFNLVAGRYQPIELLGPSPRFWFDELELGLGVWQGCHLGIEGKWLRWYDTSGDWVPSESEGRRQAETEAQAERLARESAEAARESAEAARESAEAARESAEAQADSERLARRSAIPRLRSLGLTSAQIAEAIGLSIEEIGQWAE